MKLTPHEEKILNIIKGNPEIIDNPNKRATVAKKYGLTEKTLRNRIAELKKRGLVKVQKGYCGQFIFIWEFYSIDCKYFYCC